MSTYAELVNSCKRIGLDPKKLSLADMIVADAIAPDVEMEEEELKKLREDHEEIMKVINKHGCDELKRISEQKFNTFISSDETRNPAYLLNEIKKVENLISNNQEIIKELFNMFLTHKDNKGINTWLKKHNIGKDEFVKLLVKKANEISKGKNEDGLAAKVIRLRAGMKIGNDNYLKTIKNKLGNAIGIDAFDGVVKDKIIELEKKEGANKEAKNAGQEAKHLIKHAKAQKGVLQELLLQRRQPAATGDASGGDAAAGGDAGATAASGGDADSGGDERSASAGEVAAGDSTGHHKAVGGAGSLTPDAASAAIKVG